MVKGCQLADFDNNWEKFIEVCYHAYLDFWASNPSFLGRSLERNRKLIDGKEKDFWGIVHGHSSEKAIQIEQYEKLSLLRYIIHEEAVQEERDVRYFRRLHNRKVRIEVFSIRYRCLVVLQEIGSHKKVQFITAHPLSRMQLENKMKQYKEYKKNKEDPL